MKDRKETFMCNDALADMLGRIAFETDRTKSDIVRTCILLSIDTVRACPSLTNRITIEDRIDHQRSAG